jgi:UDP-N-acetylmuramate--alanine ligase
MFEGKIKHVHLIGIGGSGMSGIAKVLLAIGYKVTGSDIRSTAITEDIERSGGKVYIGHNASNIEGADVVVVSSAIKEGNIEVEAAYKKRIPVIPRAEMLGELMRLKYGIAVAGAHGKTTTTSMISLVLTKAGLDPTVVIGGIFNNISSPAKFGNGKYMVAETDESDGSFLNISPIIAVVTNIDAEHLDFYESLDRIKEDFLRFINKVPFYGCSVLCIDDENIEKILSGVTRRFILYGLSPKAEVRGDNLNLMGNGTEFDVFSKDKKLGRIYIKVPGLHYVRNALAAVAVGLELGIEFEKIKTALENYSGVKRRFQLRGQTPDGIVVMDDYAHHPAEIKATLEALRIGRPDNRVIAVFQPHRYTRTKFLWPKFGEAFDLADLVVVTEIYPAGEAPIPGVSSGLIVDCIKRRDPMKVEYVSSLEDAVNYLCVVQKPGDVIITLGAGDVWTVGVEFLQRYKSQNKEETQSYKDKKADKEDLKFYHGCLTNLSA